MDIIIPDSPDEAGAIYALPPALICTIESVLNEEDAEQARRDIADWDARREAYVILQCMANDVEVGRDTAACCAAAYMEYSEDAVDLARAAVRFCIDHGVPPAEGLWADDELRDIYAEASSLVMTGWRP